MNKIFLLFLYTTIILSQTNNSPVFKNYEPKRSVPLIKPSDVTYQLWQGFELLRSASNGDAASQHELGLRYLTGKGFPVDTSKAASWIKKAAEQNLTTAQYNFGIFLNNGWGIEWNPFDAYKYFSFAAEKEMMEAEYVQGIFFTDNLVVPQNWNAAYTLIKKSAEQGYEPAKEALPEIQKRISKIDTTKNLQTQKSSPNNNSAIQPIFLDFSSPQDTTTQISDTVLVKDFFAHHNEQKTFSFDSLSIDSTKIHTLEKNADIGYPELLTLLGRYYEKVPQKVILSASYYVRAIRSDARYAPNLLWNLIQTKNFQQELEKGIQEKNPIACYVIAQLVQLNFENRITEQQAFSFLQVAVAKNYIPAIIESGLCYFFGRWISQDEKKGTELWKYAFSLGSREAKIQLITSQLKNEKLENINEDIQFLQKAMNDGSVLAQISLGYCYEKGIGVKKNFASAAQLYREAAQRGNKTGFVGLKRLYNTIRPKEKEFQILE